LQLSLQNLEARHPAAQASAPAALRGVSLHFAAGEQVAVIGPSGSGKTTLLHAAACALEPSAGELRLGEQHPWQLPRRALHRLRHRLFLAPQTPPLPPRQRVVTATLAGGLAHMSLAESLRSLFYPADIEGAHAALSAFDVADKLFERVDRLSGGERQRVGLARLLRSQAALWLVDEPLSALDPARSTQALQVLTQSAKERGATLICSLHQVDRALAVFPRVVGLREGQLQFDLPAKQVTPWMLSALYAQHEHELQQAQPPVPDPDVACSAPAVMHCR
jgi:phosphonate transport system ATP-binding protein